MATWGSPRQGFKCICMCCPKQWRKRTAHPVFPFSTLVGFLLFQPVSACPTCPTLRPTQQSLLRGPTCLPAAGERMRTVENRKTCSVAHEKGGMDLGLLECLLTLTPRQWDTGNPKKRTLGPLQLPQLFLHSSSHRTVESLHSSPTSELRVPWASM